MRYRGRERASAHKVLLLGASLVGALAAAPSASWAGETPLYQPAPEWVVKAALPPSGAANGGAPRLMIFDNVQRVEGDRLWVYSDVATRVDSADALAQITTMALPWMPDKGDLIVHDITIIRGPQTIDALASGKKFNVLRREEALEQRQLTGILTATFDVEGVQIGDVVRLRFSITARDAALGGRVQQVSPLLPAPLRIGAGQVKLQWRAREGGQVRLLASGITAKPVTRGEFTELVVPLPIAKQPDMPFDAPLRFQRPPMLEFSTFADWSDVSKTMAPLYATEGAIAPDGPLARELALVKAEPTPIARAQRALRIVQDQVRYLAVGMNGGNYVPQKPEQTWSLRYGDCKAKTLLLLALLRGAGVEAEAVVASAGAGDFVAGRLPSAAAFDHVLVRAVIDGQDLWLDGTASGARIDDIHDTPSFGMVLPLRAQGAALTAIPKRPLARPLVDLEVDSDESASVDLPAAFTARATLRGGAAAGFTLVMGQLDAQQREEMARQFFTSYLGEGQFTDLAITSDPDAATVTLSTRGVVKTGWRMVDKRSTRRLSQSIYTAEFAPDRARTSWQAIPVTTPGLNAVRYRLRVRLPQGGRGVTIEGEPKAATTFAGMQQALSLKLEGGIATFDERIDTTGVEIAAADIPAARESLALAQTRAPKLIAPTDALRSWELGGKDPPGATQLAAIKAVYTKTIAAREADDVTGHQSRVNLLIGIGDRQGALADLDAVIAHAPDVETYLRRAQLLRELGRIKPALADADKAVALDPGSTQAIGMLATLKAESGDLAGATALLDKRIALASQTSDDLRETKASVFGEYGDPLAALALLDELAAKKPGSPSLLNARCWIKGTRSVAIESALKDCTSAIELSSSTFAALDSRAMVWFRLGKFEDALRDLDAALLQAPGLGPSRFMRAVVLNRLGRTQDAAAELTLARRLYPGADAQYARYGIKP